MAAFGQPLLAAALESPRKVVEFIGGIIHELKVTMLCVGAANLAVVASDCLWSVVRDVCVAAFASVESTTRLIATAPMADRSKTAGSRLSEEPQHHDLGDLLGRYALGGHGFLCQRRLESLFFFRAGFAPLPKSWRPTRVSR